MKRMCIYVYISTNITESLLHSRNQHVKQLYLNKNKFKKIPFPHFFSPLLSIHSTRCLLLPREKKPLGKSCGSLLLLVCLDPFLNLPFLLLNRRGLSSHYSGPSLPSLPWISSPSISSGTVYVNLSLLINILSCSECSILKINQ